MNKFFSSSRILLPLALSAALALSGCQADGTPAQESAASSGAASAAAATAAQTSEVLSTLTDTELKELISGTATLDQLAQQRTEGSAAQTAVPSASAGTPSADASSTAPAAEAVPAYEQELKGLINQLYDVKARAESGLNGAIQEATAEYKALPASKQTKARKISICMGKAGQLKALESSCDKEVADIVAKMRALLTANGQSTALADEAEATYTAQKNAMYASLTSKLYG